MLSMGSCEVRPGVTWVVRVEATGPFNVSRICFGGDLVEKGGTFFDLTVRGERPEGLAPVPMPLLSTLPLGGSKISLRACDVVVVSGVSDYHGTVSVGLVGESDFEGFDLRAREEARLQTCEVCLDLEGEMKMSMTDENVPQVLFALRVDVVDEEHKISTVLYEMTASLDISTIPRIGEGVEISCEGCGVVIPKVDSVTWRPTMSQCLIGLSMKRFITTHEVQVIEGSGIWTRR